MVNVKTIMAAAAVAAFSLVLAWGLHHERAAKAATARAEAAQARAELCRAAMDALEAQAKARAASAAAALEAAQKDAQQHQKRADALLRQPAAVPGDDCASARVRARAWLEGRQ